MKRLFIAIVPPEPVRHDLARLQKNLSSMNVVPEDKLHLTLKFLGATPEEKIDEIRHTLSAIQVRPFILEPFGSGCFPSPQAPKVVWIGFQRVHPRLFQLRKAINDQLLRLGIEPDTRPYHPHITLARCEPQDRQRLHPWLLAHREADAPAFQAGAFVLMESISGQYQPIDFWGMARA